MTSFSVLTRNLARPIYYRLRFLTSGGTAKVRLSGLTATFRVDNVQELKRANGMRGERSQVVRFVELLKPGDVVWDIGANIGTYSVFSGLTVGSSGKVYAFEPEAFAADRLEENAKLNHLSNVQVIRTALSDRSGKAVLHVNPIHGRGNHSLEESSTGIEVGIETQTADDVAEGGILSPTIVKLDVEGHEDRVVAGMRRVLSAGSIRVFFCEVHRSVLKKKGVEPGTIRSSLEQAGLTEIQEFERGDELHLLAVKSG